MGRMAPSRSTRSRPRPRTSPWGFWRASARPVSRRPASRKSPTAPLWRRMRFSSGRGHGQASSPRGDSATSWSCAMAGAAPCWDDSRLSSRWSHGSGGGRSRSAWTPPGKFSSRSARTKSRRRRLGAAVPTVHHADRRGPRPRSHHANQSKNRSGVILKPGSPEKDDHLTHRVRHYLLRTLAAEDIIAGEELLD